MKENEFRCMKCKKTVAGKNIKIKRYKARGAERAMAIGECPHCKGKVFKFVKA